MLLVLYASVTTFLLVRIGAGLIAAYRVWLSSSPCAGFGSSIRISRAVHSPWTFGLRVVLPAGATDWPMDMRELVLAHERAHVQSGDFFFQLLARVYTALFWWSPLGWWLQRELAFLSEQTSDHAALLAVNDPAGYADILMRFSVAAVPKNGIAMARSSRVYRLIDFASCCGFVAVGVWA